MATQVEEPSVDETQGTAELETTIQPELPPPPEQEPPPAKLDGEGLASEPPPDELDESLRTRFRRLLFEVLSKGVPLGEGFAEALVDGGELDFARVVDQLEEALERHGLDVPPAPGLLRVRIQRGRPHKRHVSAGGLAFTREWKELERAELTASALRSLHDDPLLEVQHLD